MAKSDLISPDPAPTRLAASSGPRVPALLIEPWGDDGAYDLPDVPARLTEPWVDATNSAHEQPDVPALLLTNEARMVEPEPLSDDILDYKEEGDQLAASLLLRHFNTNH